MTEQYGSVNQARIHVQRADARWACAVEGFDPYPERLQRLADAADQERKALLYAEVCNAPWSPLNVGPNFSPAKHLEPGHRPGPDSIWTNFDNAVTALAQALGGDGHATLAIAFGKLSQAASTLADELTELELDEQQPRQQTG